jgi:phosphatidylglycerophosphatase A
MNNNPSWKSILSNPIHFIAFGFGSGLAPKAPGTFGTLIAIPFYLLIQPLSFTSYLAILILLSLSSIYIAGKSAQLLGIHDHGGIVIDEICGYLVTMTLAPSGWQWVLCGFILFRIFDILKPWPINILDKKVSGGVGIVLDDLMAGIYALLSLELIVRLAN